MDVSPPYDLPVRGMMGAPSEMAICFGDPPMKADNAMATP